MLEMVCLGCKLANSKLPVHILFEDEFICCNIVPRYEGQSFAVFTEKEAMYSLKRGKADRNKDKNIEGD